MENTTKTYHTTNTSTTLARVTFLINPINKTIQPFMFDSIEARDRLIAKGWNLVNYRQNGFALELVD